MEKKSSQILHPQQSFDDMKNEVCFRFSYYLTGKNKARLSPITKFRACVRKVISCLSWLTEEDEEEGLGDSVAKNVRLLQQKKTQIKGLTFQVKTILMKPVEERTDEDKKILYRSIKNLKCFKAYPDDVKWKLTAVAGFVTYGPGRVLLRQGHFPPQLIYFICSGQIMVSITTWDELLKEYVTIDVGTRGPGDMFGEVSLLEHVPRTATCTTILETSFVILDGQYFKPILEATIMKLWKACQDAMKMFPYFDGLSNVAIRECCMLSQIVNYVPKETILGFGKGRYSYTHFILSGECQVIEELKVVVKVTRGKSYPQRLYKTGEQLHHGELIEIFFLQAYEIYKGQCFCIGENLEDRAVIALTPVECLLCPEHWMKQYNPGKIWDRIRHFFAHELPSKEDVFRKLIQNREQVQYRQTLAKTLLKTQLSNVSYHDIPYHIRITEDIGPHRRGYTYKGERDSWKI